jgi:RNA processing factor Prp31
MNKVFLQLWEESNTEEGFLSDGCSLHINLKERDKYVTSVYKGRDNSSIPNEYDRIVGDWIEVFVDDKLYNMILTDMSVKLPENSFQNLLKFEEIIFNKDII